MKKKRIAIINQRYGLEVNGGSEYYTRMIAEHLSTIYDVEVLTTCALDYDTWKNFYTEGIEYINKVKVRRFSNKKQRNMPKFKIVSKLIRTLPFKSKYLERLWVNEQGPYCPELIEYIVRNQEYYDNFIFVTYLYYLTVKGIQQVSKKSILIPTAHDEPYIYFDIYRKIFESPKCIIYLTEEEKRLVESIHEVGSLKNSIIALGIDTPEDVDVNRFREKYRIEEEYIIYMGRVDLGKKCDEMIEFFIKYKRKNPNQLKLVLLGKCMIEIPKNKDVISLGFVTEEDKYDALSGARALILPSQYESLSIAVLEAMSLAIPVVVNGKCAVLKAHCLKSDAGMFYEEYYQFAKAIDFMITKSEEYNVMCKKGLQYIEKNYRWEDVVNELQQTIDK